MRIKLKSNLIVDGLRRRAGAVLDLKRERAVKLVSSGLAVSVSEEPSSFSPRVKAEKKTHRPSVSDSAERNEGDHRLEDPVSEDGFDPIPEIP